MIIHSFMINNNYAKWGMFNEVKKCVTQAEGEQKYSNPFAKAYGVFLSLSGCSSGGGQVAG